MSEWTEWHFRGAGEDLSKDPKPPTKEEWEKAGEGPDDDEDVPASPSLIMALGFDPDEEDWDEE